MFLQAFIMELKVWVDGIKRVVCGVTDNTTCQDIVIALAHAMGRTGRFTLIEKWRDNERPLSPGECPLQVLQKWGEFANEVNLYLYESGSRRHKKQEHGKEVPKTQDRFTHNFTPPEKPEANVKRSLTFSGARKYETQTTQNVMQCDTLEPPQRHGMPDFSKTTKLESVTANGTSWSSSSSLSSQNSGYLPPQQKNSKIVTGLRRRSSPQPPLLHSTPIKSKTQHSSHLPSQRNIQNQPLIQNQTEHRPQSQNEKQNLDKSRSNDAENRTYAPLRQRRNSHEEEVLRIPNADIPVYTERKKSSHKPEIEEYDLDSNFPDVVRETARDFLIEEYQVPGSQGHSRLYGDSNVSMEERERVKLLRLVTMQNERIKMQDSQIELADTEILSREEKQRDTEQQIQSAVEKSLLLSQKQEVLGKELADLENGHWIQAMDTEKQREKELKTELGSLKVRLEKCENSLHQFQTKVKICSDELEKEKINMESDEKRRKEEEIKLQTEISELKKDLEQRLRDVDDKTKQSEELERELAKLEEELKKKEAELTDLEKHIQKENLKFFTEPQKGDHSKSSRIQETGAAVLKVLEGSFSPDIMKKKNKILNNPLAILELTKTQNGVWV